MDNYNELKEKMNKAITFFQEELDAIRVGRATPASLDRIFVDYYGAQSPITQIGTVSVPDPRTLMIQPWDASMLKEIEKAIQKSELGINPQNDGKCIRLIFPPLTEERRKEHVKTAQKKAEEAKVTIRNIRRDAMEMYKKQKKNSEITEDDLKDIEKDVQKITDQMIEEVDKMSAKKQEEILAIWFEFYVQGL